MKPVIFQKKKKKSIKQKTPIKPKPSNVIPQETSQQNIP